MLINKRIALLVEAEFQDLEVHYPRYRLKEECADVVVIGTGSAQMYRGKYGLTVNVDLDIDDADPAVFDGVIIPGGWAPDRLRMSEAVVNFVRRVNKLERTIGCICHGGWVLASADIVRGKRLTSYIAIKDDLIHAGAEWVDEETVIDGNLITARKPDDLPAFMRAVIRALQG